MKKLVKVLKSVQGIGTHLFVFIFRCFSFLGEEHARTRAMRCDMVGVYIGLSS